MSDKTGNTAQIFSERSRLLAKLLL